MRSNSGLQPIYTHLFVYSLVLSYSFIYKDFEVMFPYLEKQVFHSPPLFFSPTKYWPFSSAYSFIVNFS